MYLRRIISHALVAALPVVANLGAAVPFHPSGSPEIDQARREIALGRATNRDNHEERALLLYSWIGALQQQGADTREYFEGDRTYYRLERELLEAKPGAASAMANDRLADAIDDGYRTIERIQTRLIEQGPIARAFEGNPATLPAGGDMAAEWPMFQANEHNTGFTQAPGPRHGRPVWKFPVGLGWYSRPVVEAGRVYLASPGMRTTSHCLDLETGKPLWNSAQSHPLLGIYKYPAIASTPIVREDDIILREINSHGGNEGQARNLVFLEKATGKLKARRYAGHIDYRTQYAPVAAGADYIVYPFGVHDIYSTPPICQNFNRLICADRQNVEKFWDLNIGDIDALAEPTFSATQVFCGTMEGYLYAITPGPVRRQSTIAWSFKADGAVNTAVAVQGGMLYFGANGGSVYCLEESDGTVRWQVRVSPVEPRARKHFSTPLVHGDRVYIGSANGRLYCFEAPTGRVVWERDLGDWIRARPAIVGDALAAATLDGRVHWLDLQGNLRRQVDVSSHPIYADLAAEGDRLLVADSNLYAYCLDSRGALRWRFSLLPAWENAAGERIFTDQLSGGTFYQSKPTAHRGKVFFGTPAGFLHAVDARSGREVWRFEMGGAISVGPACADGRVFAGQQGGERFFYCVNAEDGALIWKQTLPGGWVWGSAAVSDGRVYVPTVSGYAVCLDAKTGHIVWMYPTAKSLPAEPAVDGGMVYFGSWSRSLYAFDKATGEVKWKQSGIGLDSGTLIAHEGKIYVPHHANVFSSLAAADGTLLSRGNTNAKEKGNFSGFNATPAFHEGRAYFTARGSVGLRGVPLFSTVYCLDTTTAKVLWTHPDGGGLSAPAVANGRVYIGSGNTPFLYCLDAMTGERRWVYKLGHRIEEATLCIYQDRLFALAADGYVHAIE